MLLLHPRQMHALPPHRPLAVLLRPLHMSTPALLKLHSGISSPCKFDSQSACVIAHADEYCHSGEVKIAGCQVFARALAAAMTSAVAVALVWAAVARADARDATAGLLALGEPAAHTHPFTWPSLSQAIIHCTVLPWS